MKSLFFSITLMLLSVNISYSQVKGTIVSDTGNITIVKVWGTHYERGYAYGFLLSSRILNVYNNYLKPAFGANLQNAKTIVQQGTLIRIDQDYKDEAQGMISGISDAGGNITGMDYSDLLVANSYLDLQGITTFKNLNFKNGCSSLMSWDAATNGTTLNGKSAITRHLDWSVNSTLNSNQVMVIHIPSETDEQPWALIGFAGQMSALSGFNNSGVSAFQHMMSGTGLGAGSSSSSYEPIWFTIRKGLEKYDYNNDGLHNVQDIKDALLSNTLGYADGFIVATMGPAASNQDSLIACVAELTPATPYITFRTNTFADSIPSDNLYVANSPIKRNNAYNFCTRYNNVKNNIGNGLLISANQNWDIMRLYSNVGAGNIQMIQLIPEDRTLNLAVYKLGRPAYQNNKKTFNIDSLFSITTNIISISKDEFFIYPNPAKTKLYLGSNGSANIISYKIYDNTGKIVVSEEASNNSNQISVDLKSFSNGIYYLNIDSKKGKTSIPFVVN
ncbi:MAG: T9SS type A sorting domain-containing protein [Bacteroidota bacterium]